MASGWMDAKVLTSFIAHFHKLTQKLCSDSTVNNLIMAMPSTTMRMLLWVIICNVHIYELIYEHALHGEVVRSFNSCDDKIF